MEDEAKPYLLTEASELMGLSVDAIRKRIERNRLRGTRSNEDKQWRVWLTSKDIETAKAGHSVDSMSMSTDESRTIKALEDELATVREALGREQARLEKAESLAELLQAAKDAAQAEAAAERLRAATAAKEVDMLREALARADDALAEARKPFWRRWIG